MMLIEDPEMIRLFADTLIMTIEDPEMIRLGADMILIIDMMHQVGQIEDPE